jgi:HEAT repeat protein
MRTATLSLSILAAAAPLVAQEPPRRADARAAQRALIEAQRTHAADALAFQRMLLEAGHGQTAAAVELQRALLEAQHGHGALSDEAQRALLEAQHGQNAAAGELQRALLAAQHGQSAAAEELHRALVEAQRAGNGQRDWLLDEGAFQAALDRIAERGPAEAWAPQDPADSLYRVAREQLNRGNYREAVRAFDRIGTEARFARSEYRPAAFYWQAFALSRIGSDPELRQAQQQLDRLRSAYPRHELLDDAASLAATIDSRLARNGDAHARRALYESLAVATRNVDTAVRALDRQQQCEDDDVRSVALNALLQMESANALPILRELMARRDACSTPLRRRALMMIAQDQGAEAHDILIEAALNDPDAEVREQATFWLAHVQTDAAVDALARILDTSASADVQQRAALALGQHPNARAAETLRAYALRTDVSNELRRQIVLSLAHAPSGDNGPFLRQMYERTTDAELKSQIVMGLSMNPSPDVVDWVMGIAADADEPRAVRQQALMMAVHSQAIGTDRIARLYDETTDPELRRLTVMSLSQRVHDRAAIDKLIEIVRTTEDTDLQKQVIIMLGQSRDPRVAELLAEIIRRPVR